jgi:hypothetical protein
MCINSNARKQTSLLHENIYFKNTKLLRENYSFDVEIHFKFQVIKRIH